MSASLQQRPLLQARCASAAQHVNGQLARTALAPVLPEINSLPGAEQQSTVLKRQAELAGGEGRTDVGRHVVGPFIGVDVGAQVAPAAHRPDALFGHQGPQVGREVAQHPRIGVLIDREAAGGVQTHQVEQAELQAAGGDAGVQPGGEIGETLPGGLNLQGLEALAQHRDRTNSKP